MKHLFTNLVTWCKPSAFSRVFAAITLLSFAGLPAKAQETPAQSKYCVKLLTIGNSFADNATAYLPKMAQASGKRLVLFRANLGGHSLQQHASYVEAAQADPESPIGRAYKKRMNPRTGEIKDFNLKEALECDTWDYVTIQQVSALSFRPETYQPYAGTLIQTIHQYAPKAEIMVHETWAYREDAPLFKDGKLTQPLMYEKLKAAYENLAAQNGLRILPVGDAMQMARATPRWHFTYPDPDFNYANPPEGALPKQPGSLNVGWVWRKDKSGASALSLDAIHCNREGQFLGAAVLYEILFADNVEKNTFIPEGMTPEDATALRQIAHRAVTNCKQALSRQL